MIKKYQKKIKQEQDQRKKDKLKIKMMEVRGNMEDLLDEAMTEDKFWGMQALDNDIVAFDYGRDVLKDGIYDN